MEDWVGMNFFFYLRCTLSHPLRLPLSSSSHFFCAWSWGVRTFDESELVNDECVKNISPILTQYPCHSADRVVRATHSSSGTYYEVFFFPLLTQMWCVFNENNIVWCSYNGMSNWPHGTTKNVPRLFSWYQSMGKALLFTCKIARRVFKIPFAVQVLHGKLLQLCNG